MYHRALTSLELIFFKDRLVRCYGNLILFTGKALLMKNVSCKQCTIIFKQNYAVELCQITLTEDIV